MYKCDYSFCLLGLEAEAADAIKAVEPLEWFTHRFVAADKAKDVDEADISGADVVIFKEAAGLRPLEARRLAGDKGVCILCRDDASELTSQELAAVDGVWPERLAPDTAELLFSRLMRDIKLKKDAWLWEMELQAVIDTSMDLIWFKGRYGEHWRVNDAFCQIVEKTKEDIRGKQHYYIWGLTPEEYAAGEFVCLETEQDVKEAGRTCRYREHVKGPEGMREMITLKTPLYDNGEFIGTVGVAKDITKEMAYRKKLMNQAQTDELTGLLNRRYFFLKMGKMVQREVLSLCYMDLDFFKELNDRFGHKAGDDALIGFSDLLAEHFEKDVVARLGGDEFVVGICGNPDKKKLQHRLDRFMEDVHGFFSQTEEFRGLSVSIGVVVGESAGTPVDVLLHQGDIAMYEAKKGGKNRYCFYSSDMYDMDA